MTHAIPLVVLPSSLWWVGLVLDLPVTGAHDPIWMIMPVTEIVGILMASVVSEAATLMSLGLAA